MPKRGGEAMAKRIERQDIMLKPDAEKIQVYEEIHRRYKAGERVEMKEHRSGFPAVTVDCGDIHILTDILSVEAWWQRKRETEGSEAQIKS
jgi:hypothetical protein